MSTFRVLQFNMQFGQGWNAENPDAAAISLDDTLAEIKRHKADVILLQEVEQAQPGGKQAHPPPNYSRLRAELDQYDSWFSYPKEDPRELPFGIGLAIFSRTPLRDRTRHDIGSPTIEFDFYGKKTTPTDRLLIGAKTTIGGRELQLFNTHLLAFFMIGSTSADHPAQRAFVVDQLARANGAALLTGDFNVRDHHSLINQFADRGFSSVQDAETTWRRGPYVLDHIFYNRQLRAVSHAVVPTRASDHHLLIADFEFV